MTSHFETNLFSSFSVEKNDFLKSINENSLWSKEILLKKDEFQ